MSTIDAVALTQELVRFDTRNPPGQEAEIIAMLDALLRQHGFATEIQSFGEGRQNLVARIGSGPVTAMFTGHVDTVPLGTLPWTQDPFGGAIVDGRLYGRGACDMKAGVAAMIAAAAAEAGSLGERGSVALALTGGEETGSHGAIALAGSDLLGEAAVLVVGEPTANRMLAGHKGALWLSACSHGVTAHGSTPHLGDNALYKAARGITALEEFQFNIARHPVMGMPTLNVGTLQAGQNINSVPDRAEFTIDIRTIPGQPHAEVTDQVAFTLGSETEVSALVDLPAVWSDPGSAGMQAMAAAFREATGREADLVSANYFTDASVLMPALGHLPTVICGPGDAAMAHKTDEYCEVEKIQEAVTIYRSIIGHVLGRAET
jgi:succinyl-diaminopimelate desuccinylase